MKKCVIYQPVGLGDILWVQPIVDKYLSEGYEVHFPVSELYYEMVSSSIKKDNLIWHLDTADYPMREYIGSPHSTKIGDDICLPIFYMNYLIQRCPVMISKYYSTNTPIVNWHSSVNILRNYQKEEKVFDLYQIDKTKPFAFVNKMFGTPPTYKIRKDISVTFDGQIIEPNYDLDIANGIKLFDWIGILEQAAEIHTVETSFCYLIDKYASSTNLNMYEKRTESENNTYYGLTALVYRNKNWIYRN